MSSAAGFLEFFVLEASDYIEQLDALIGRAGPVAPDAAAMQRVSRALRGSATMAKLPSFAELAGTMERIGRALRDDLLAWEPSLAAPLVAAVDDLKILVRAARSWSPAEDRRATTRAAELSRLAPEHLPRTNTPPVISGGRFFAGEASNIAAGLELLVARPSDRDGGANVLRRVRALRGVAGIREIPSLAEAMEGAELAARPLELGERELSPPALDVLRAAAALLRRISVSLNEGTLPDPASPERAAFERASEAMFINERARERIVPIEQLFFGDGGGVVSAATTPPTTPTERFRLEMVSQAEHLRGLVADARRAPDDAARERFRRELRRSLASLSAAAESFGERAVASQLAGREATLAALDAAALDALEQVSNELAHPGSGGADLARRVASAGSRRVTPPSAPLSAPIPATPAALPAFQNRAPAPRAPTPPHPAHPPARAYTLASGGRPDVSGEHLATALEGGIANLGALANRPLTPSAPPEQPPVPIDALVYRGRAALERAIEIRDELRRAGGPPQKAALDELFELLDLALS